MGTRWDFTAIPNNPTSAYDLGCALQSHLQYALPPIDLSLIVTDVSDAVADTAFVDLVAFKNRDVSIAPTLPPLLTVLDLFSKTPPAFAAEAVAELRKTPAVLIACIASKLFSTATCFLYSDSLCSTGYLHFVDGAIDDANVYGAGGTDTVISVRRCNVEFSACGCEPAYEYWLPWQDGVRRYLGWTGDSESLGSAIDGSPSYRLYLMEQRTLVLPPRQESA